MTIPGRAPSGVSGVHGNGPSRHVVAMNSARFTLGYMPARPPSAMSQRRSSGAGSPCRAACVTAGSSAAIAGLRSASMTSERKPYPPSCAVCRPPPGCTTAPRAGFVASAFATVATSPTRSPVMPRHELPAQKRASVFGSCA